MPGMSGVPGPAGAPVLLLVILILNFSHLKKKLKGKCEPSHCQSQPGVIKFGLNCHFY